MNVQEQISERNFSVFASSSTFAKGREEANM